MANVTSIVMIGATGAVGSHVAASLTESPTVKRLTLLGRRPLDSLSQDTNDKVAQHKIDIFDPDTYAALLQGHDTAICTMGVGQPSKMARDEFIRIEKTAVLAFAEQCKEADIRYFHLLSSVGVDPASRSFYLRTKGEVQNSLRALQFDGLYLIQPSMILTPGNRYGALQAITLAVWPLLSPLLIGSWRKYRGVPVDLLGRAIAANALDGPQGEHLLQWDDFMRLAGND